MANNNTTTENLSSEIVTGDVRSADAAVPGTYVLAMAKLVVIGDAWYHADEPGLELLKPADGMVE